MIVGRVDVTLRNQVLSALVLAGLGAFALLDKSQESVIASFVVPPIVNNVLNCLGARKVLGFWYISKATVLTCTFFFTSALKKPALARFRSWFGIDAHALEKHNLASIPFHGSVIICFDIIRDSSHLGRLDRPDGAFIPSLIEYLRQNVSSHILLSDEHLSSRLLHRSEIQSLAALLQSAGHELVVIAVTRDRDDWLRSKYSQQLKEVFINRWRNTSKTEVVGKQRS